MFQTNYSHYCRAKMSKKLYLTVLYLMCLFLFNLGNFSSALARWATFNDMPMKVEKATSEITVNKNGTYTGIYEKQVRILQENAKTYWAHLPILYNHDTHNLRVLQAYTLVGDKKYPLNLQQMEDKPVAENVQGFDQYHKLILAYPHLESGSSTYLKYQIINQHAVVDNLYTNFFVFGNNSYCQSEKINIRSELPLYIRVNDPEKILQIKQHTKQVNNKKWYLLEINQIQPCLKAIVNENQPRLNPKHLAYVAVSSINNWNAFGKAVALEYEPIQNQPLPPLYKEIAAIASTQKTPIEKINTVTSLLTEKLNYVNQIRTIKGHLLPQSLDKVASTRLGDCKDFAMATKVILSSIGIPSKIALVMKGDAVFPLPDLFGPEQFSHAILKIELPDNTLWVDPSNFASMANHIFPEISDRKALVLDTHHSRYETIPALEAQSQRIVKKETWDMRNPSKMEVKGSLEFLGNYGRLFAGIQNKTSNESIQHIVLDQLGTNYGQILSHQITVPDLKSRIVKDHTFHYSLQTKNSGLKTSAGIALPLTFNVVDKFLTKTDTVADTYLGTPSIIESTTIIKNIKPMGKKSLDCHIKSPWADVCRTVQYQKNQIIVEQKMEIKKSWLEAHELQSDAYKALQLAVSQHFNNGFAIVFEQIKE